MTDNLQENDTILPIRDIILICSICQMRYRLEFSKPLESIDEMIQYMKKGVKRFCDCPANECSILIPIHKLA